MRLIDREKVLKIAECYGTTHGTTIGRHSGVADTIYDEIAKLSTVDAEPVKHGKWLDHKHTDTVICSQCKRCFGEETPFCPNCGAKMDGGDVCT